ncbi:endonuclease MutS2 [Peribacillus asahii]|uniref:Endonuclease MutS2 n=1 Tax=Peribacillus asahii TaxID=228899 RepID=A0A3T0KWD7_9BACI|nr:endonuclease MutS2 [Peribacillus asahii]AZV44645.1 recombination and DNA strand exchange inhibitor protein [Peribacillus asahii]USK84313.1 endonuclease MutS2 [Peribacillus asahii]
MHQKALNTLEFTKIKEQLVSHCTSSIGKDKAVQLAPSTDFDEVVRWQEETDESAKVLRLKGNVPLGGIFDIRPHAKRAQIGGMLSPIELMEIASTIRAGRVLNRFFEEMAEQEIETVLLTEYIESLHPLIDLQQAITYAISEHGEVLDSASEQLRTLRNQLRTNESRVREKLESMIRSSNASKMLSDAIVTIRNDRFVIPVKQEYRSHYGGIIHDQSSSGQTLFIEPQAIVQLNNALQETRVKEQLEIERILTELSVKVGEYTSELLHNVAVLAQLDFVFAKARYAKVINGSKPQLNQEGRVKLFKAKHPLIPADVVVANDIFLGEEFTTIVITGPNTGGKTVTLKTIGLCTLMAQAGLQIPALDGSEVAVFSAVYADIGDEQSIEQSLSTFSSHMVNIVEILEHVDHESLVLFDELGAGTDPQEGAALAISILDEVYKRGARVIATTHYPELKAYGYDREGVINASVEFDVESLRPTYKLLIGVPGRSNAFEISKRLGLNEKVINHARSHIGEETNQVETMIASLEASRRQAEEEEKEAADYLKQSEKLHRDLQQQIAEYYNERDKLMEKASTEAAAIVENAKKEAEKIIRDLRKLRLEKRADVKEHELIDAKKRLEEAAPELKKSPKMAVSSQKRAWQPGDEVKVTSFGQKGYLIEKASSDEWHVQMGIMKMKVKEADLEFIKSAQKEKQTKPLTTIKGKDYHVSLELDLRGERYENALSRVEKYIDDALLASYPRVSVIHGKGTGALRQGVQEYLKNHRSVKRIRFGEAGEGGNGVTIVEFK